MPLKQAEDTYKKAQALVYSLGNLTLLLLVPRYWMPSVYLIQYSVSSTETPGKVSYHSEGKGVEQASEREAGQGGARSLLLHGHSAFTTISPPCHHLSPSFYISSNTSTFQKHISLTDKAAASSTLFSNFARSTPGNKGRDLGISC